jgi:hypothetical protein
MRVTAIAPVTVILFRFPAVYDVSCRLVCIRHTVLLFYLLYLLYLCHSCSDRCTYIALTCILWPRRIYASVWHLVRDLCLLGLISRALVSLIPRPCHSNLVLTPRLAHHKKGRADAIILRGDCQLLWDTVEIFESTTGLEFRMRALRLSVTPLCRSLPQNLRLHHNKVNRRVLLLAECCCLIGLWPIHGIFGMK